MSADGHYTTVDFNPGLSRPVLSHIEAHDQWRDQLGALFKSSHAQWFWVFSEIGIIRDAYQHPEVFSSTATQPDVPDAPYQWIPQMLDPPDHTKWRQLLAPWFSPGAVAKLEVGVRQRCAALIRPLVDRGGCDFVADFAQRFPTSIFMDVMGLPPQDMEQFLGWEDAILHSGDDDPDHAKAIGAMFEVMGYFDELIKQRRSDPRDDLVTAAATWTIDGEDIPHDKLLSMYLLMFMAGLDTVTIQLCYMWWHLARHDDDRRRIVEDPPLVHGCPMKVGDMVLLPLCAANRDPAYFEHPGDVVLDRLNNNHAAFGAGPNRCLGSHLARRELRIAMEEWHALIPDYHLPEGLDVREHGGMFGIDNLELVWG